MVKAAPGGARAGSGRRHGPARPSSRDADVALARRALAALLSLLSLLALLAVLASPASATVPGMPRVPQAPTSVFHEDFEHQVSRAPVSLADYVGRPTGSPSVDARYTADDPWLIDCNGTIVAFESPDDAWDAADCPQPTGATGAWAYVRMMAWALGSAHGDGDAAARDNHAVTAWTYSQSPGPGLVQLATHDDTPITFPQKHSRFITFSIDGAELCAPPTQPGEHNVAQFEFYLVNQQGLETPAFNQPIEPCSDPRAEAVTTPGVGNRPAGATFHVGTFASDDAVLFSGDTLGIAMRNAQGLSHGNDAAFDDIRVIDATPQLDKSFSPAVLNRGETSILTFTITNTSDLAAKDGWSFTDALPAGLVVVPGGRQDTDCPGGAISAAGGTVSVRGSLSAGEAYCEVHIAVTSAQNGAYTNGPSEVAVDGVNPPGDATVEFGDADMSIVKSASDRFVDPGSTVTYRLTVTNHGPNPAERIVVSDPLEGLSAVSADPECDVEEGRVTCRLDSLGVGDSHTFTVVAHIPAGHNGGIANTAAVTSATPDPYLGNNEDYAIVRTRRKSDVAIVKLDPEHRVGPGDQVTYTLVVTNHGPGRARNVIVSDPLPPELELISAKPSQGHCETRFGVLCGLGRLKVGASAQIHVTVRVAQTAVGEVRNVAKVESEERDPDPGDNESEESNEVTPDAPPERVADLRVRKTARPKRIEAGRRVTYRLKVSNLGPDAAPHVQLTDTADSARRIVSVHTRHGSCHVAAALTCRLGRIEPGAHATVRVVAQIDRAGAQRNVVGVASAEIDPRPADNVASATVKVVAALRLRKTASAARITAGQRVRFRIRVTNPTAGPLHRVVVCDSLPAGLSFVRAAPKAHRHRGKRCWRIGVLHSGGRARFMLTARARRGTAGALTNVATATARHARRAHARATVKVSRAATRPTISLTG